MPQTFKTLEISGKGPEAWSGPSQTQRSQATWPESARQPPKLACPAMPALPRGTADLYLDKGTHMILTCALSPLYYPQLLNCQWRKRRWHSLLKYKMPKNPSQKSSQKPKNQCQGCSLARMRNEHSTFCIWHPKDHSQAGPKQPSALCASVRQPSEPVKCKEFPSEDWPPPSGPRAGGVRDTASSCPG